MQRWIPTLAIVLVLQLAVAGWLGWQRSRPVAAPTASPLVAADLSGIDRVVIEGPKSEAPRAADAAPDEPPIELVKKDGRWTIPGYHGVGADAAKLQGLLDKLTKGSRGLPVTTTAESLPRFKVTDAEHERRLVAYQGDKAVATVYVGTSPGLRRAHLRSAEGEGVYPMDLSTADFPLSPPDWVDPGQLKPDTAAVQQLELVPAGQPAVTLARDGSGWKASGLPAGRTLDSKAVAPVLDAMAGLQVRAVLGTQPQADWSMDKPLLTLRWKAGDTSREWKLARAQGSDIYVVKPADRDLYFEVLGPTGQVLADAAALNRLAPAPAAPAAPSASTAAGASAPAGGAPAASAAGN